MICVDLVVNCTARCDLHGLYKTIIYVHEIFLSLSLSVGVVPVFLRCFRVRLGRADKTDCCWNAANNHLLYVAPPIGPSAAAVHKTLIARRAREALLCGMAPPSQLPVVAWHADILQAAPHRPGRPRRALTRRRRRVAAAVRARDADVGCWVVWHGRARYQRLVPRVHTQYLRDWSVVRMHDSLHRRVVHTLCTCIIHSTSQTNDEARLTRIRARARIVQTFDFDLHRQPRACAHEKYDCITLAAASTIYYIVVVCLCYAPNWLE